MLNKNEILNSISKYLHQSAPTNYDSAELIYKLIITDEEWSSFSAGFDIQGKKAPPTNFAQLQNKVEPLLDELHILMKNEENKDWRKLTLTIKDRKVNVEFDYSEQSL
ncbi:Uncharacterised protein [Actinobacillus ureae]|uniref:Uncharacterized protein n=1 Tax=Actinobacillus ureae ATCC 25976 TaxID=887324 RepID=E8KGJ7_9PAST|nr:immunity protein YezG family protein [Actinobacillus ureae]EFX91983.1 hypothetical protein HMPREF0027_0964 [Actinobacillus ureae ATCC 25976]SUT85980.1 Uncharacterised protein [Actinobacillus ureae]SUU44357.1 Uncharacterised protein [Actinobacillus ureae]